MKLLGFGDAVNVSLGLPIVRTSVDHGTAYDRAKRFDADASGVDRRDEARLEARAAVTPPMVSIMTWNGFGAAQSAIAFLRWKGVPDAHRFEHADLHAAAAGVDVLCIQEGSVRSRALLRGAPASTQAARPERNSLLSADLRGVRPRRRVAVAIPAPNVARVRTTSRRDRTVRAQGALHVRVDALGTSLDVISMHLQSGASARARDLQRQPRSSGASSTRSRAPTARSSSAATSTSTGAPRVDARSTPRSRRRSGASSTSGPRVTGPRFIHTRTRTRSRIATTHPKPRSASTTCCFAPATESSSTSSRARSISPSRARRAPRRSRLITSRCARAFGAAK